MNTKMFNDPSHFFPKVKAVFLQVQRSKSNFLHRGVCSPLDGVIGRRESSAELGERSDKLQRGARMPGQRQAGQLVFHKKSKERLVKVATEVARLCRVSIQSCTQNRPSPKVQLCSRD